MNEEDEKILKALGISAADPRTPGFDPAMAYVKNGKPYSTLNARNDIEDYKRKNPPKVPPPKPAVDPNAYQQTPQFKQLVQQFGLVPDPNNPHVWIFRPRSMDEKERADIVIRNIDTQLGNVPGLKTRGDVKVVYQDNPDIVLDMGGGRGAKVTAEDKVTMETPWSTDITEIDPVTGQTKQVPSPTGFLEPWNSPALGGTGIPPKKDKDDKKEDKPAVLTQPKGPTSTYKLGEDVGKRPSSWTAQPRTTQLNPWMQEQTGVDTAKTPEMLRAEHFQRLADELNARQYYKPGAMAATTFVHGMGAMQGGPGVEGGAYQLAPLQEFQDTRENLIHLARQGDKLAYEEWGKIQAADDVLRQVNLEEQMNINDIEKLAEVNDEAFRQLVRVNKETLRQRFRVLDSNIRFKEMMQEAMAETGMSAYKLTALLEYFGRTKDFYSFAMWADNMGFTGLSAAAALFGQTFHSARDMLSESWSRGIQDLSRYYR